MRGSEAWKLAQMSSIIVKDKNKLFQILDKLKIFGKEIYCTFFKTIVLSWLAFLKKKNPFVAWSSLLLLHPIYTKNQINPSQNSLTYVSGWETNSTELLGGASTGKATKQVGWESWEARIGLLCSIKHAKPAEANAIVLQWCWLHIKVHTVLGNLMAKFVSPEVQAWFLSAWCKSWSFLMGSINIDQNVLQTAMGWGKRLKCLPCHEAWKAL